MCRDMYTFSDEAQPRLPFRRTPNLLRHRCALRPGNAHSADGWRDVLEPVVTRYRHRMKRR